MTRLVAVFHFSQIHSESATQPEYLAGTLEEEADHSLFVIVFDGAQKQCLDFLRRGVQTSMLTELE